VNYDQLQGAALLADSQQLGIEFPVFSNDPAAHFNLPKTQGLPATYIVNSQGQLAGTMRGEQNKESILAALEQLGWSSP
jgi:cytochrome oxidase Cu insertion factor (SCO1/SenC/PrrC family)